MSSVTQYNATSVITPVPNGNGAALTIKARKSQTKGTTAPAPKTKMTEAEAVQTAFNYGSSMAGLDGSLTLALIAFKGNEDVRAKMKAALIAGYMVKKLSYDDDKAYAAIAKATYSDDKKGNDNYRTFDEQRVVNTANQLFRRADENAGTKPVTARTADQERKAEAAKERKEEIEKLAEIVHPKDPADFDIGEALTRLVSTMKSLHKTHAGKFRGDAGMAWRDWLNAAPKHGVSD